MRRMRHSITAGVATALTAGLVLTGCAGGGSVETGSENDGKVVDRSVQIALTAGTPSGFNPHKSRITVDTQLQRMLYDTVVRADDNNTLVGSLATSWEVESATDFTFTIRDDATCSDGSAITAETVAASLEGLADPANGSSARSIIFGPGQATVTADGDDVHISLSQPFSELPRGLAFPQAGIVCADGLADPEGLNEGRVDTAFSGPYVLADHTPGVSYTLAFREDYDQWPKFEKPLKGGIPSEIVVTVGTDSSSLTNSLLAGNLDVTFVGDDNLDRLEADGDFAFQETVTGWSFIAFNEREGSVFHENEDLRRAVAQAVQREAFNKAVTNGRAPLIASVADPAASCALDDESLLQKYDPKAAAKVLEGASMSIAGLGSLGPNGAGNTYVQEALTAAGANVSLKNLDTPAWATIISQQSEPWDLTILGAQQPFITSITRALGPGAESGGRSVTGSVNPEGEAAYAKALAADNDEDRCAAFEDAQRTLLERVDVVPLSATVSNAVTNSSTDVRVINSEIDFSTLRVK